MLFFTNVGTANAQLEGIIDAVSDLFEDDKKEEKPGIPCASQIERNSDYQVVSCSSCTLVDGKNGGMPGQCVPN